MPRLTKSEREKIIIDFVKGKPTPGYEVVELSNGKYQVKEVKIIVEVEEEDQEEQKEDETLTGSASTGECSGRPLFEKKPPVQQPKPPRGSNKQNALELLKQLTAIMEDDDDTPDGALARRDDEQLSYEEMTYQQPSRPDCWCNPVRGAPVNFNQNWNRKRLRF
jgi:hypothetical protein